MSFILKNPWLSQCLLSSLGEKTIDSKAKMLDKYVQVVNIYSSSNGRSELYVSDSQYYIMAHVNAKLIDELKRNRVNKLKSIKGGILSVDKYNFAFCSKTQAFILHISQFKYHGGEGEIINAPTDINSSPDIKRVLYPGLYEIKPHEIQALIESECWSTPESISKRRKTIKNNVEVVGKIENTFKNEDIFDMTLRNIKFTQPFGRDSLSSASFNDFSFIDIEGERLKRYIFNQFVLFCKQNNFKKTNFTYFDISSPCQKYKEIVSDFLFKNQQSCLNFDSNVCARTYLSIVDSELCFEVIKQIKICGPEKCDISLLKESGMFDSTDISHRFVLLKLLFIKILINCDQSTKIYTLFQRMKKEINKPNVVNVCETKELTTEKYNPIKRETEISNYMAYTVKMKFIEERCNKKVKIEDEDNVFSLNKLERKMMKSNSNKTNVVEVEDLDMNSIVDIEAGEGVISTWPSSFSSFCDKNRENEQKQPSCTKCSTFIKGVYDLICTRKVVEDNGNCYCEKLKSLFNVNFETKDVETENKKTDIQIFVEETSFELALLLVDQYKEGRKATLKPE
ncbi:hypothetical protein NGRA_0174 [Nosema granulosis]|uniref:Shelterin complex subunit TPP1/Est3 domain-containing protein n=1 Tax=Nosema granulosis TaxID=83296 RepID=A0A9P6L0T4_9MICR|nr:hypothetical protein NGRA_0174 [Nosema granulosis]